MDKYSWIMYICWYVSRNREFWCKGYYVDTVGKNTKAIKTYIAEQLKRDKESDQISMFGSRPHFMVVSVFPNGNIHLLQKFLSDILDAFHLRNELFLIFLTIVFLSLSRP